MGSVSCLPREGSKVNPFQVMSSFSLFIGKWSKTSVTKPHGFSLSASRFLKRLKLSLMVFLSRRPREGSKDDTVRVMSSFFLFIGKWSNQKWFHHMWLLSFCLYKDFRNHPCLLSAASKGSEWDPIWRCPLSLSFYPKTIKSELKKGYGLLFWRHNVVPYPRMF